MDDRKFSYFNMNDKYHNVYLTTANMTNVKTKTTSTSVHEQNIQNSDIDTDQSNNEEKEISINDFLEFMNISCHLSDMIRDSSVSSSTTHINYNYPTSSNSCPKIGNIRGNTNSITSLQHKDVLSATCSNNNSCSNIVNDYSSSYNNGINGLPQRMRSDINFKKLSRNRLVNDLYGFAKVKLEKPKLIKDEQEEQQQQILLPQPIFNEIRIDESDKLKRDGMEPKARQRLKHSTNYEEISARSSFSPLMFKKTSALHPKLHEKLEFVINEGILDGVLPYICPTIVSNSTLTARSLKGKTNKLPYQSGSVLTAILNPPADPMIQMNEQLNNNHAEMQTIKATSQTSVRRKSISRTQNQSTIDNKGTEVVIHVVDEVKNSTKDFTCPQALLIEKMRYFADVTIGQKLDDMDISVHCDIQIFDWLMRWVKHSANIEHPNSSSCCSLSPSSGCDSGPQLDSCNVVPILVSANFLQMEPLLLDCLSYCHAHLSEVVRMSTSLSCLNDSIITRLAAMFTNIELESVRDKKERVTPRLWTKLIISLFEPETEALRGHYYSLAGLFRCSKCGKCLTNTIKSYINCVPNNIRLNRWGQLVNHHVRDNNWEINLYIAQLFRELKSWRRVYWKLWGHCHFMYCCVCETHFPVYQMTWCRYHPDNAVYLGSQVEGRLSGPKGRYPCCSQQAFLYDPMPGPNGCQFREHSVLVSTERERAILAIAKLFTEGNVLCECPSVRLREAVAVNDIEPRWLGLCLTHTRGRPGLLPPLHPEENMSRTSRRLYRGGTLLFAESSTESDTTDSQNVIRRNTSKNIYSACGHSSSSDGCESECVGCSNSQFTPNKKSKKRIGHPNDIPGRHWSGDLSARSNQDHQREFEEKVMKQVVALVNKKIGFDQNLTTPISTPLGGSYVRLEAEWKEKLKQRNIINNSNSNNNVSNNNSLNNNMNNNNGNNTINNNNNNNNMVGNNNSSNNTTSIVNKSGTKPKRLNTIPSTN